MLVPCCEGTDLGCRLKFDKWVTKGSMCIRMTALTVVYCVDQHPAIHKEIPAFTFHLKRHPMCFLQQSL